MSTEYKTIREVGIVLDRFKEELSEVKEDVKEIPALKKQIIILTCTSLTGTFVVAISNYIFANQ